MKRSWFTETEIVSILKEADAGMQVKEVCRKRQREEPIPPCWSP